MGNKRTLTAGLVLLLAVLACNDHGLIPLDRAIEVERIDNRIQFGSNLIDILWVIDNSGSMCQEQEALTTNFQTFIDGLTGVLADFNMAVITMDMRNDRGVFRYAPGLIVGECAGTTAPSCPERTGPVLRRADYVLDPENPFGELDSTRLLADFRCIATQGTNGDGFEKGLDAVAMALSPDLLETANAGFRRENAWLAIIFVTDENDCSDGDSLTMANGNECEWRRTELRTVQEFVDFIRNLPGTANGENVLVAGIIGPDNGIRVEQPQQPIPSCSTQILGQAFAGYRYEEFIEAFGDRGVTASICHDSFQVALDAITSVIRASLAIKCLRTLPPLCQDDLDCQGSATCEDPTPEQPGGMRLCSDFEMVVEVKTSEQDEWVAYRGPDEPDSQYMIHFDTPSCPTGMGIEFLSGWEPPPGAVYQIRYPVEIQLEETGGGS
ncbi:MAG: hypothetical protein JW797_17330 [Bradymonadales bacterium]|nr:hypothetical protein [Bradymonadales bacterium]